MAKHRTILLFGGSFSPPTVAHEAIIAACLSLPGFDEVWVMPSGDRTDKSIALPDKDRMNMLEIVRAKRFAKDARLHISDFELRLPRPTTTYQTVQALAKKYQDCEFWFVFGADSYKLMTDWPHGKELREGLRMVLFGDKLVAPPKGRNLRYIALGNEFSDVSSTQAREALAANRPLYGLVSEPIAAYLTNI